MVENRWRPRVRPRKLDVDVEPDEEPMLQLTIFEKVTLLTRRTQGGIWRQYPVSAAAIAQALNNTPSASGLLPRNTLGTGTVYGRPFYVVWIAPSVRRVQMEHHLYTIPLPPLVWAACGADYRVWALDTADYPNRELPLMTAPFPNTYSNGSICWGTVAGKAAAAPKTLLSMLKLYLEESVFNLHVAEGKSVQYPKSVVARWDALEAEQATEYPLDDLIPAEYSLSWLLSGGPFDGSN